MLLIRLVCSLSIICCFSHANAQTLKTFYVGHSLSDQIPDMVQSLSNDHEAIDFAWVYQGIPGAPLRYQWDRKFEQDYTIIEPNYYGFYDSEFGLAAGGFDALVLTESVPRYASNIGETYEYADSFFRFASTYNPGIQVYLYEDWHCLLSGTPTNCDYDVDSSPWRQRLEDDLAMWEAVVDTLNRRYNPVNPVCLIPVGQGLAALYDSIQVGAVPTINEIEDLFTDNIHLSDVGKYYAACIHFAMIHKVSPVGLTNQLQVWWGGDFDPPSPELARKFQEMAWETVLNYPASCLSNVSNYKNLETTEITISPNPTSDIFTIRNVMGEYSVVIIDASGKVFTSRPSLSGDTQISLENLPAGLYFLKITDDKETYSTTEKILKQEF